MIRQASKLIAAWPLVAKRSLAHWRVLSSVVAGVLLASAIMSSSAIYLESLRHLALKHAINLRTDNQVDILASYQSRPISRDDYEHVATATVERASEHLSWMLGDGVGAVKTATFYLTDTGEEEEAGSDDRRSYFAFAPRLREFTTLSPGSRMPSRRPVSGPEGPLELEAVVPVEAAEELEYEIGDRVSLVPSWQGEMPYVSAVITGTFERNDEESLFSHLYRRSLQAGVVHTVRALPLFIHPDAYLDVLGPSLGNGTGVYAWMLDVVPDRLNDENAAKAGADIITFQRELTRELGSFHISTALLQVFSEYNVRLFFTRAPMLVFLILIAVVILYYVVTLSSLLVEQQRGEIALLRSRGASQRQILAVFVLEGGTISILAVALGPLIAAAAVSALGLTPIFSDLTGNSLMAVDISRASYVMSAVGGGLSFIALMVPAVQAARVSVTRHRQEAARPSQQPFFHRYYLDVLLLVVGILLFRQLDKQGSVLARDLLGEVVVNELLLAVPGLMLIAVAMILLRLFPVAMSVSSRLLGRWLPVGLALGLWQMAREPTHYARLSLLLILTAGLGVFAASFVATLERSYEERVLYSTGSDVRIEGVRIDNSRFLATFSDRYERSRWVDTASPAFRSLGFDYTNPTNPTFTVLGIDGETFPEVAWVRDDFHQEPLTDVLASLARKLPEGGLEFPSRAVSFTVLLKAPKPDPDIRVSARVRDANNRYYTYSLGPLGDTDFLGNVKRSDWLPLGSSLLARPPSADPLKLVALTIHAPPDRGRLPRGSVLVDQVTATTMRLGEQLGQIDVTVVEPFDSWDDWEILHVSAEAEFDEIRTGDANAEGGDSGSLMFRWNDDDVRTTHGIVYGFGSPSMPVLASKSFLESTGYQLGEEFLLSVSSNVVRVSIEDSIEFFPTMNPNTERFLIADLKSLVRFANLDPIAGELRINEAWISSPTTGLDRLTLVGNLKDEPFPSKFVVNREKRLEDFQVDPLAKSGWSALLFIAFAAALITSAIGFLVHAYVSVRVREGQFALMRTIGFSLRQLVALVWLEQVLLIAVGMALGTWMGGRLSKVMMPFLGHDDRGTEVVPPFIVEVNWDALALAYAAMALLFAIIIVGVIAFIRKISLHRILRLGEG